MKKFAPREILQEIEDNMGVAENEGISSYHLALAPSVVEDNKMLVFVKNGQKFLLTIEEV